MQLTSTQVETLPVTVLLEALVHDGWLVALDGSAREWEIELTKGDEPLGEPPPGYRLIQVNGHSFAAVVRQAARRAIE